MLGFGSAIPNQFPNQIPASRNVLADFPANFCENLRTGCDPQCARLVRLDDYRGSLRKSDWAGGVGIHTLILSSIGRTAMGNRQSSCRRALGQAARSAISARMAIVVATRFQRVGTRPSGSIPFSALICRHVKKRVATTQSHRFFVLFSRSGRPELRNADSTRRRKSLLRMVCSVIWKRVQRFGNEFTRGCACSR